MQTHHFTLIIEGPDMQEEAIIDTLFENGCDDGTIGRSDGIQFIVFDREAVSFADAVQSAVDDIECIPGLKIVSIADADQALDPNQVLDPTLSRPSDRRPARLTPRS